MKVFFRNIHLYLSLAAGLVIITCCFTGAVLVFEKELQELFNHDRYFVKKQEVQLPIEQLISSVKQQYPGAKVASVKIYPDPERSIEIGISMPKKENKEKGTQAQKEGLKSDDNRGLKAGLPTAEKEHINVTKPVVDENNKANKAGNAITSTGKKDGPQTGPTAGGVRPTHTVFINPYTSQVLELYSYQETFFYTMFSLHRWLLGGNDSIGKTITGVATFIFLFILITGIILWWPRNRAILKQHLKIKTSANWKRLNHDLHIVVGFYTAIFLFIFAFTALAWSFKWFNDGIYTVTGTSIKPAEPPKSVYQAGTKPINYDEAFKAVSLAVSDVQFYTLRAPSDSSAIFSVSALPLGAHESATDTYYIDQYSGNVTGSLQFKDKNLGQRVRSTFKPVHTGSIFGWPSKIIALLACIAGVTFPVTGTIMWLNRLKKNRQKSKVVVKGMPVLVENDEYED